MAEEKVKEGLCGICPAGCGVDITMEGERLHRVKPMEGHPLGIVCSGIVGILPIVGSLPMTDENAQYPPLLWRLYHNRVEAWMDGTNSQVPKLSHPPVCSVF